MAELFLSYASPDRERVRRIAELLTDEGYQIWWDAELPPHRAYSEVIREEIDRSKAVVVVWSNASVRSEWVRAEADVAREQHKLIQVMIDDCVLPMPFSQIHSVSLADWHGSRADSEWQIITRTIAELAAKPAADGSAPPSNSPTMARPALLSEFRTRLLRAIIITAAAASLAGLGIGLVSAPILRGLLSKPINKADTSAAQNVVLPMSDRQLVTGDELARLSKDELRIARNELYARYGNVFNSPDLRARFCESDWYRAVYGLSATDIWRKMNLIERQNVTLIQAAEKAAPLSQVLPSSMKGSE